MCHEKFGPTPKPVRGDLYFGDQNWSPRTGNVAVIGPAVPKVVLRSISVKHIPSAQQKCHLTCQKTVMDAMDSLSDGGEEAGDLMDEVYQYMTQKQYPLGCMEGRK